MTIYPMRLGVGGAEGQSREQRGTAKRRTRAVHYHLIDSSIGYPYGFRDEFFRSRREVLSAARARAEWLKIVLGLHVEPLGGAGRYLVTSGRPTDAGRMIEIEECDEPLCLEP